MAKRPAKYVPLTVSTNPLQKILIEGALKAAGIPFSQHDGPAPTVILGQDNPISCLEFRVDPERLQEAKDVLCAAGIVCDVSERLLRRTLDEVVKPLLESRERELGRLLHLVEVNNKETVAALFEATLELAGGRELLEELFFAMAREGLGRILILARALRDRTTAGFDDRFQAEAIHGDRETRISLLGTVQEFPASYWQASVLGAALLDRDSEIRDSGSEALFALKGEDCGYDPEAPPAEREEAVQALLEKL
jgi:hypothetical protein